MMHPFKSVGSKKAKPKHVPKSKFKHLPVVRGPASKGQLDELLGKI